MTNERPQIEKRGDTMFANLQKLIRDEEAPTAVEYAIMVAGIAVLIIAAVFFLGTSVKNTFNNAGAHMPAAN